MHTLIIINSHSVYVWCNFIVLICLLPHLIFPSFLWYAFDGCYVTLSRSLPTLEVVGDCSLMSILRWNLNPNKEKTSCSSSNGQLVMVWNFTVLWWNFFVTISAKNLCYWSFILIALLFYRPMEMKLRLYHCWNMKMNSGIFFCPPSSRYAAAINFYITQLGRTVLHIKIFGNIIPHCMINESWNQNCGLMQNEEKKYLWLFISICDLLGTRTYKWEVRM